MCIWKRIWKCICKCICVVLQQVMEEALRHFKFELPSSEIRSLEVSAEMIRQPHRELDRMLRSSRARGA